MGGKIVEKFDEKSQIESRETYDELGKLQTIEDFYLGKISCLFKYDEQGKLQEQLDYHDNGVLSRRIEHLDLDRNLYNTWEWDENGRLLIEDVYLNNGSHRLHCIFSKKNGRLLKKTEYKDRARHGCEELYFEDTEAETLKSRAFYLNGKATGEFLEYFPNGQLEIQKIFDNGQLHGLYTKYYASGKMQETGTYTAGNKQGPWIEYFEDGVTIKYSCSFLNDRKHGFEVSFNRQGQVANQCAHINGQVTKDLSQFQTVTLSPLELFHENGVLKSRVSYQNHQPHGPFEEYFDNGIMRRQGAYYNRQLFGEVTEFNSNGKKSRSTLYDSNQEIEQKKIYFESGQLKSCEIFKGGALHSTMHYFENGNLEMSFERSVNTSASTFSRIKKYIDGGILLEECEGFYAPGSRSTRFIPSGRRLLYNEQGILVGVEKFIDGHLHGLTSYGFPFFSESIKVRSEYQKNQVIASLEFHENGLPCRYKTFYSDVSTRGTHEFNSTKDPLEKIASLIGQEFGSYRLLRQYNLSTNSDIFLAETSNKNLQVVIKILKSNATATSKTQFLQDSQALKGLRHLNLASVLDVGEFNDRPYMIMELVEGCPLEAYFGSHISLDTTGDKLKIFSQIVSAIKAMHDINLVHGDIHLKNIVLLPNHNPKIFGFANLFTSDELSLFQQNYGLFPESDFYQAPELVSSLPSRQTDIYALGIVLGLLLKTKPSVIGSTFSYTPDAIGRQVPRADLLYPKLSDELKKIVVWMTSAQPSERPNTVDEILAQLLKLQLPK